MIAILKNVKGQNVSIITQCLEAFCQPQNLNLFTFTYYISPLGRSLRKFLQKYQFWEVICYGKCSLFHLNYIISVHLPVPVVELHFLCFCQSQLNYQTNLNSFTRCSKEKSESTVLKFYWSIFFPGLYFIDFFFLLIMEMIYSVSDTFDTNSGYKK